MELGEHELSEPRNSPEDERMKGRKRRIQTKPKNPQKNARESLGLPKLTVLHTMSER